MISKACLSIVIPLYCEAHSVDALLVSLYGVLETLDIESEVILVDDGSSDGTWKKICEACPVHPALAGIRFSRNFGKEAAIAAGLDRAAGDAVIVMDGDLQHPPALIPLMVQKWRDGAQVVEAVKTVRQRESIVHSLAAKSFYRLFHWATDLDLVGATDFKLLDRKVVEAWKCMPERKVFFRGMATWLGFAREAVGFEVPPRCTGQSNWTVMSLFRLAVNAITAFSSLPLRAIFITAVGFSGLAVYLGLDVLYKKAMGLAVDGFSTVIILLLMIGAAVLFSLSLMASYVAQIYEEVKSRPRYLVQEEMKCGLERRR